MIRCLPLAVWVESLPFALGAGVSFAPDVGASFASDVGGVVAFASAAGGFAMSGSTMVNGVPLESFLFLWSWSVDLSHALPFSNVFHCWVLSCFKSLVMLEVKLWRHEACVRIEHKRNRGGMFARKSKEDANSGSVAPLVGERLSTLQVWFQVVDGTSESVKLVDIWSIGGVQIFLEWRYFVSLPKRRSAND